MRQIAALGDTQRPSDLVGLQGRMKIKVLVEKPLISFKKNKIRWSVAGNIGFGSQVGLQISPLLLLLLLLLLLQRAPEDPS